MASCGRRNPSEANVWDQYKAASLPFECDPGARFFVSALRRAGCATEFSCEGHPDGFYVTFRGPETIARRIAKAGYLTVEVEDGANQWSVRSRDRPHFTDVERVRRLRWAADAWMKAGVTPDPSDLRPGQTPSRSRKAR